MTESTIHYTTSLDGIQPQQLEGLHGAWPNPPSPETFLQSLRAMNAVVLALDSHTGQIVGFICGMTDRMLVLYIWDHEVLPEYQGRGIEDELIRRMLAEYGDLYQVNTITMPDARPLFERHGFAAYDPQSNGVALTRMRMEKQAGQ
jgi:ribosomal protein S18 acetylase RimI-like enzyme